MRHGYLPQCLSDCVLIPIPKGSKDPSCSLNCISEVRIHSDNIVSLLHGYCPFYPAHSAEFKVQNKPLTCPSRVFEKTRVDQWSLFRDPTEYPDRMSNRNRTGGTLRRPQSSSHSRKRVAEWRRPRVRDLTARVKREDPPARN